MRWDGNHKRNAFLADQLGRWVEFVPVCPEVEMGLGAPREPIRLVAFGAEVRFMSSETGRDLGASMDRWAGARVRQLQALGLCGYVLKGGSPSCGLERVRIWPEAGERVDRRKGGEPHREGRGRFAQALVRAMPELPVIEECALADPVSRERWLEQVRALHRRVSS